MSITTHQRPGVYSDYVLSSASTTTAGASIVAVAALNDAAEGLYTVTSGAGAAEAFGTDGNMVTLIRLALENGAGTVLACPVAEGADEAGTLENYTAAFDSLLGEKTASFLICDSSLATVHGAMKTALETAAAQRSECIGLVGLSDPTVAELTARAAALNCERMVLVGPDCRLTGETGLAGGCCLAAAAAGVLAGQTDPALPLSGATLVGLSVSGAPYSDTDLDALVLGGVTLAETVGGTTTVVRAVTTRTTTDGAADSTWRELTTMLVIDEVIPAIRNRLAAQFTRCKNNQAARSAIRAQVVLELNRRVGLEYIDGYDNVTVAANETDPTVCDVGFDFTVVHGLSRICVTAHITV